MASPRVAVWLDARPKQARFIDSDWVETSALNDPAPIATLMEGISYGASYVPAVVEAAKALGIQESRYCFTVRASEIAREVPVGRGADGSVFVGFFGCNLRARSYCGTQQAIDSLRQTLGRVVFHLHCGVVPAKGIRLITKRCKLSSEEEAEALVAVMPVELPPVALALAAGLSRYFERNGIRATQKVLVEAGPRADLVDRVAQGMLETAQGEGVLLVHAVERAIGPVDDPAVIARARNSRIWFAESAVKSLSKLAGDIGVTAPELCERLGTIGRYVVEEDLLLRIQQVGRVTFAQSAGVALRSIAAVMVGDF